MRNVPIVLVGLLVLGGVCRADTVVLKNGTKLEGEVVTADKTLDRIVMKVKVGSSQATLTLKYADVVELTLDDLDDGAGGPVEDGPFSGRRGARRRRTEPRTGPDMPRREPAAPKPAAPKPAAPKRVAPAPVAPKPGRLKTSVRRVPGPGGTARPPTPVREDGHRILFLVDASGSMGIGKRWEQATEQLQKMIERLPDKTPFDVMLFHDVVVPLFTTNNTLFKTPKSGYRTAKRMRETGPDMRRGTNLYHALVKASLRWPKKIVVISDGVLTRGGPFGANHALRKVREARAKGVGVDFFCAQDGTYQAPEVENKDAARQLLSRYARAGKGVFLTLPGKTKADDAEPLPNAFNPLPGTVDGTKVPWRIEVLAPERRRDFKHWEAQWKVIRGHIPTRFRVRVWDPLVNSGRYLDVWEYGGAVWLDVYTGQGKVLNLRFHRSSDKKTLVTDREIRIVDGGNARLAKGALHDRRYAYVAGGCGAVKLVYRRGNESFRVTRTTSGQTRLKGPLRPPTLEPEAPALPPSTELAQVPSD